MWAAEPSNFILALCGDLDEAWIAILQRTCKWQGSGVWKLRKNLLHVSSMQ